MRTTLDIDPDILSGVKARARRERRSAGAVLSEVARQALTGAAAEQRRGRLLRISPPSAEDFTARMPLAERPQDDGRW